MTRIAILLLAVLSACSANSDPAMWQCQLEVQKGNAGKSAADQAERGRDIHACMEAAGYRLKSDCSEGTTDASCYGKR